MLIIQNCSRQLNKFFPQTEVTTFAFSSVYPSSMESMLFLVNSSVEYLDLI